MTPPAPWRPDDNSSPTPPSLRPFNQSEIGSEESRPAPYIFPGAERPPSPLEKLSDAGDHFPRITLSGAEYFQAMIEEIARVEGVPPELPAVACLGAVSAACGTGIEVIGLQGRSSRANLYIVAGVSSGTGKSLVWKHAFEPLEKKAYELIDQWTHDTLPNLKARRTVLEGRIKQAQKKIEETETADLEKLYRDLDELEKQMSPPRIIVEDVTTEALEIRLQYSGQVLTLVSSDARSVVKNILGRYNRRNETEEDSFIKAWSGDRISTDRIGRHSVALDRPCLSMCIAVQPDKVDDLFKKGALGDSGFLQRILLAPCEAERKRHDPTNTGINTNIKSAYGHNLLSIIDRLLLPSREKDSRPTVINLDESGMKSLASFYDECVDMSNGDLQDVASFVCRWAENALRIAVCLNVVATQGKLSLGQPISGAEMDMAIQIQRWFASKSLQLLSDQRNNWLHEKHDRLQSVLSSVPNCVRSLSELQKRNNISSAEVHKVVSTFPNEFEIQEGLSGAQGGRPSICVRLKSLHPHPIQFVPEPPSATFS